jgi:hypothetical protein
MKTAASISGLPLHDLYIGCWNWTLDMSLMRNQCSQLGYQMQHTFLKIIKRLNWCQYFYNISRNNCCTGIIKLYL